MRTKLFAIVLGISFALHSLPVVQAQEVPPTEPEFIETMTEPVTEPEPVIEESTTTETIIEEPVVEESPLLMAAAPQSETASSTVSLTATDTKAEVEGTITLPNGCTAMDVDGGVHAYPEDASGSEYLAICALVEAKKSGLISDFEFKDFGWGLMITSIDGIVPGDTEFWELFKNGAASFEGVQSLGLSGGDTISFIRTDYLTPEEEVLDQITIHIGSTTNKYANVIVPNHCVATSTDGVARIFPEDGSDDSYLAICALVAAKEAGKIDDFTFDYFPFGAFVSSVNDTQSSGAIFWAMWSNEEMSEVGVSALPVALGDVVSFRYSDSTASWPPVELGERYDLHAIGFSSAELGTTTENTGEGGGNTGAPDGFDTRTAYDFLATGQRSDGSWDSELVTDWAALAFALPNAPSGARSRLTSYLHSNEPRFGSVRDYERHAVALMALGINPYTGGPHDYVTPIVQSYDGTQIDNPTIVNDDAFGLLVLLHAGYTKKDEMIKNITSFIVDQQHDDGSWDGGIDVSGAYVQILSEVRSLPGVSAAISRAESYMHSAQHADGGFGDSVSNPFATTWALQSIHALGDSPENWKVTDHSPLDYLTANQNTDGGIATTPNDYSTRAWATAYAIPAAKGLTWSDILKDFEKPVASGGKQDENTATTTDEVAVTPEPLIEPYVATSTDVLAVVASTSPIVEQPEAPKLAAVEEATTDAPVSTEKPASDLTAAAIQSGVWNHLKGLFASFWSFLKSFFT